MRLSTIIILAITLLVIADHAQAQWSHNGLKVFYNNGNVGVGTGNPAYTLHVQTDSGRAVYAAVDANTGATYGLYGLSRSTSGRGVLGLANAGNGITFGVIGQSNSTTGRGVYGIATASSGVNIGIYGKSNSPDGYAGFFSGNVGLTGWIGTTTNQPVDIHSGNERVFRVEGGLGGGNGPNVIGGHESNSIAPGAHSSTIGGGIANTVNGSSGTVSGGTGNVADNTGCTVGGGLNNTAGFLQSTVSGGQNNVADSTWSTVGGGGANTSSASYSTIGGGGGNTVIGNAGTVSGGFDNHVSGLGGMIPGGMDNHAAGDYAFASGRRAIADHDGAFVWADSTNADIASAANNEMTFRSTGGVRIFTNTALNAGVTLAAGGSAWAAVSDRNLKENFEHVDPQLVLEQLVLIPITTWNYKSQDASIRHIGPMAQDFHAAFGLGEDELRITTIDADGVLFAAAQGLHRMARDNEEAIAALHAQIAERDAQIESLRLENEAMRARLERLELLMSTEMARR